MLWLSLFVLFGMPLVVLASRNSVLTTEVLWWRGEDDVKIPYMPLFYLQVIHMNARVLCLTLGCLWPSLVLSAKTSREGTANLQTLPLSFLPQFPSEVTQWSLIQRSAVLHEPVRALVQSLFFRKEAGWHKSFVSLCWHGYAYATGQPPGQISFQEFRSSCLWKSTWT